MIFRRIFSFLKSVLLFMINRLYNELVYMNGNGRSYGKRASERGDFYIKQFIENIIHDRARKYDPYMVDGTSVISYGTTSLVLGQAYVTGLSTLRQADACFLIDVGNNVFINGTLGAGPLTYERKILFKFGNFKRNATILISVMDIKVSIDFGMEKETGRNGFLRNFTVNELKAFNFSINGLSYFDWAINLVLCLLTLVFGRIVRNLLENELEQYIFDRLPDYQFPVQDTSNMNGTNFKIPSEYIQNKKMKLSETFVKQNLKRPKDFVVSPIAKKNSDLKRRCNRMECGVCGSAKKLKLECAKSYRSLLHTNKRTPEMNSFDLPEQILASDSESLQKDSCDFLEKKSEDNLDSFSEVASETGISKSSEKMKANFVSHLTNRLSQRANYKNCTENSCPLFDLYIPDESSDTNGIKSNGEFVALTTSPVKGLEYQNCESPSKGSIIGCSDKDIVETVENFNEKLERLETYSSRRNLNENLSDVDIELLLNFARSKKMEMSQIDANLLQSKTEKLNTKKETLDIDERIELPAFVDNYDLPFATKWESSNFDVNAFERKLDFFGSANLTVKQALEIFVGDITKEMEVDGGNENVCSTVENIEYCQSSEHSASTNTGLKLCNAEMIQNDLFKQCRVDETTEGQKNFKNLGPEDETQIKYSESLENLHTELLSGKKGVEISETSCISDIDIQADGQANFKPKTVLEPEIIRDKKFDQFDERCENEVIKEIAYKYVQSDFEESKLNKVGDSLDSHCASDGMKNSGKLNIPNFQVEETACNDLLNKLACLLNESVSECTDCVVDFSSLAGMNLNEMPFKIFTGTNFKKLPTLLQEEIITQTLKLKSDLSLEYDTVENECPSSFQF